MLLERAISDGTAAAGGRPARRRWRPARRAPVDRRDAEAAPRRFAASASHVVLGVVLVERGGATAASGPGATAASRRAAARARAAPAPRRRRAAAAERAPRGRRVAAGRQRLAAGTAGGTRVPVRRPRRPRRPRRAVRREEPRDRFTKLANAARPKSRRPPAPRRRPPAPRRRPGSSGTTAARRPARAARSAAASRPAASAPGGARAPTRRCSAL